MPRIAALLLVVATALPLVPACGGSGGGGPLTLQILGEAALDGFVRTDGLVSAAGGGPAIGDLDHSHPGLGHRVFFSFSLAALPAGATVTSVALQITQGNVVGAPYATHGVAVLDHLDYGASLDAGDYDADALTLGFATASSEATLSTKTLDVTSQVLADLGAARPRSQFRLRFSLLDSDDDGAADAAGWVDSEVSGAGAPGMEPKLIVTYVP
jgi:hypothetical protein